MKDNTTRWLIGAIAVIVVATLVIVAILTSLGSNSRDKATNCLVKANAKFDLALGEISIGKNKNLQSVDEALIAKGIADLTVAQVALEKC